MGILAIVLLIFIFLIACYLQYFIFAKPDQHNLNWHYGAKLAIIGVLILPVAVVAYAALFIKLLYGD